MPDKWTKPAIEMVADFEKATTPGAFPKISRKDVVIGLRERIRNPAAIHQGASSLCGPANLLYCVCSDSPEAYVDYVTKLYDTGEGWIGSIRVKPGADCKNYRPPSGRIAHVDWIGLASLRDSENSGLDYQSVDDRVSGITPPSTLRGWFERAGYNTVQDVTNFWWTKGKTTLATAHRLAASGHHVCLLINDDMLSEVEPTDDGWVPTHWVVLTGPTVIGASKYVSFKVYSWGEKERLVPHHGGNLAVDEVLDNFYGYVATKPRNIYHSPPPRK